MSEHMDFHEKIHIAQFWRTHIGDINYLNYHPDDLERWYLALETRGPDEIRAYLQERAGRYPIATVTGIVGAAPHPPLTLVETWLSSHNKSHTGSLWYGLGAFILVCGFFVPQIRGCQNMKNPNTLQTHPPQINAPILPGSPSQSPPISTVPATLTPPASTASPPTGTQQGQH